MSELVLEPGAEFLRFRITRVIGQGGMGRVYEAEHELLQRRIALKVMLGERVHEEMKARMIQEARSLAALEHPNVVRVYDAGVLEGSIWIAMEYLEGRTLRSLRTAEGPFSVGRALGVLIEICDGVAAAHEIHIVHRDLKPENVVITTQNQVKVLDFGAAKVLRRVDRVSTMADASGKKRIIGTPEYMSPEHLRGDTVDDRTDTYAICCMAYELFARHPFSNADGSMPEMYETARRQFHEAPPPLRSLAPHVPVEVAAMLERGLSKQAAERPGAAELAGFFRGARASSRDSAPSVDRAPFANQWTGPGSWAAHGPAVSLPQQVTPPSDPSRRVLVQVPEDAPRSPTRPLYAKTEELRWPAEGSPERAVPAPEAITVMPETTGRDPRTGPPARARTRRTAVLVLVAIAGTAGLFAAVWLSGRSGAEEPPRGQGVSVPQPEGDDAGVAAPELDAGSAAELPDASVVVAVDAGPADAAPNATGSGSANRKPSGGSVSGPAPAASPKSSATTPSQPAVGLPFGNRPSSATK